MTAYPTKLPGRSEGSGRAPCGALVEFPRGIPACPAPGGDGPRRPGPSPVIGAAGETAAPSSSAMEDGAAPRTFEVALPAGLELLSMNGREHWAVRARTFKSLKTAAWAMLKNAKLPRLERVTVTVIYDPPDQRRRDADNIAPSAKALIDAAVLAGVLASDDSRHVASVTCEIGPEVRKPSRLRMVITEVAVQSPAGGAA